MSDDNGSGSQTIEEIAEEGTILGGTLIGTDPKLSFKTTSAYTLADSTMAIAKVPPLTVEGQFQEGDRVQVMLSLEVTHVSFPPLMDKGFRVGTERRHHAEPLDATHIRD